MEHPLVYYVQERPAKSLAETDALARDARGQWYRHVAGRWWPLSADECLEQRTRAERGLLRTPATLAVPSDSRVLAALAKEETFLLVAAQVRYTDDSKAIHIASVHEGVLWFHLRTRATPTEWAHASGEAFVLSRLPINYAGHYTNRMRLLPRAVRGELFECDKAEEYLREWLRQRYAQENNDETSLTLARPSEVNASTFARLFAQRVRGGS